METKVKVLHISLNPERYDIKEVAKFDYQKALEFCQTDEVKCMSWGEEELDLTQPNVTKIHCDGVYAGDGSDTMLSWIKVEKC